MIEPSTPGEIRDTILKPFCEKARAKYNRGQAEHGGLITDRDHLAEAEDEVIDQLFFLGAMRISRDRQRRLRTRLVEKWREKSPWDSDATHAAKSECAAELEKLIE